VKIYWDSYGIVRGPSGIFVHARELQKALSRNGIEVKILDSGDGRGTFFRSVFESKLIAPEVCFREFSRIHDGGAAIYHGLSNFNLPLWHRGARQRGVKFVLTVHDLIPLLAPPEGVSFSSRVQSSLLMPRAINMADAIVAVSGWTAQTILDRYPEAEERITVIPNGFPPLRIKSDPAAMARPAVTRILTVGRSENYKRHDLFFAVLEAARGTLHGTIVTPRLPRALTGRAEELSRKGYLSVVVSPSPSVLDQIYASHDVYVQTSLLEGFCLPAAEAQSSGIPVVYTVGSGIDEVVCPDSGRGVSASATVTQWVTAILEVATAAPGTSASLGKWVSQRPTWNDSAITLKKLYNSL